MKNLEKKDLEKEMIPKTRNPKKSKRTERQIGIIYKTIWKKSPSLDSGLSLVRRNYQFKNDIVELFDVITIQNGHGVVDNNNYDSIIIISNLRLFSAWREPSFMV